MISLFRMTKFRELLGSVLLISIAATISQASDNWDEEEPRWRTLQEIPRAELPNNHLRKLCAGLFNPSFNNEMRGIPHLSQVTPEVLETYQREFRRAQTLKVDSQTQMNRYIAFLESGSPQSLNEYLRTEEYLIVGVSKRYLFLMRNIEEYEDLLQDLRLALIHSLRRYVNRTPSSRRGFLITRAFWMQRLSVVATERVTASRSVSLRKEFDMNLFRELVLPGEYSDTEEISTRREESPEELERLRASMLNRDPEPVPFSGEVNDWQQEQLERDLAELFEQAIARANFVGYQLTVMRLRWLSPRPMTLFEVGEVLSVSQERIRQIEFKAFLKLRKALRIARVEKLFPEFFTDGQKDRTENSFPWLSNQKRQLD